MPICYFGRSNSRNGGLYASFCALQRGEILICLEINVKPGDCLPHNWIACMSLTGKVGLFPGNFGVPITGDDLNKALEKVPHAVATEQYSASDDGFVSVEVSLPLIRPLEPRRLGYHQGLSWGGAAMSAG